MPLRSRPAMKRGSSMCGSMRNNKETLCQWGRLSLYCYLGTAAVVLLPSVPQIYFGIVPNVWGAVFWGPVLYYAVINMIIRFVLRDGNYQVAIRASFLGFAEAISILVTLFAPGVWKQFGVYGILMSFFHYSEFLAIALSNPRTLTIDSFMLNHSIPYALAASASWLEFIIEVIFLPDFKGRYYLWLLGVVLCVGGEILRKVAIVTAQQNFTHLVQEEKMEQHKLITHGVYAYTRHPSYVGWFWWSVGTQFVMMNPICLIIYTLVSWKFFDERIYYEESTLLNFFQGDYVEYQKRVPTGLPFIKGYQVDCNE